MSLEDDLLEITDDEERVEELLTNVRKALLFYAARRQVSDIPDESVSRVQGYLVDMVTGDVDPPEDYTSEEWFDRLYDEFERPASVPAQTNVAIAVGFCSRDDETLREIAERSVAENYRQN